MARGNVTLYIDKGRYQELKEIIRPKKISQELDDLILQRLFELRGNVKAEDQIDYDGLKKEHVRLLKDVEKFDRLLKDRNVYERLKNLAYDSGLEWDGRILDNLDKVSKGLLTQWKGVPEDAHTFISLLEAIQRKSEIEQQLELVRLRKIVPSSPIEEDISLVETVT